MSDRKPPFPRDDDFYRRKVDRPSHDAETVGPVRFFLTAAGPYATPYPAGGNVVYANMLRDLSYPKTPGTETISYTATGHYEYLGVPSGVLPPVATIVKATKIGARWWIDPPAANASYEVRFAVSADGSGPRNFICEITSVPFGMALQQMPGQISTGLIYVCDPQGCFFNDVSGAILGSLGWAQYMLPLVPDVCQPSTAYAFEPQWEVKSLCCALPVCG